MSEQKFKMVLPHSVKSLCVANVPYIETWAFMDSYGQTDDQDKFEEMIERRLNRTKHDFLNGAIEGVSLDAESKESIYDQMANSIKPVNQWLDFYSNLGIEIIIAEQSTASGRYTLDDASKKISGETDEPQRNVLKEITRAVLNGSLPVYRLESQLRFYPGKIDRFYDAYWCDLNHWLETYLSRLNFRFPEPPRLKNKTDLRVKEIIIAAKDQFNDPMSIPSGGKSRLRDQLCSSHPQLFTKVIFDQAWKVARKENLVKMENNEQYIHPK